MTDREKVIKEFKHLLNAAKGNYQDFVDLTVDEGEEILALLKDQKPQSVIYDWQCETAPGHWERKGFCPRCHQVVLWMVNREYCGFCGQKVKWE